MALSCVDALSVGRFTAVNRPGSPSAAAVGSGAVRTGWLSRNSRPRLTELQCLRRVARRVRLGLEASSSGAAISVPRVRLCYWGFRPRRTGAPPTTADAVAAAAAKDRPDESHRSCVGGSHVTQPHTAEGQEVPREAR